MSHKIASFNMTHIDDVRNVEIPNCNNAIQLNFMLEKSQDEHNRIICSFVFVHVQDIQVRSSRNSRKYLELLQGKIPAEQIALQH